jgi:hypothetical protein
MPRRGRALLVLATVGALVILLGQVLLPGSDSSAPAKPSTAAPVAPVVVVAAPSDAPAGPSRATTMVAGVPMGYSHDAGGAKAAAAGFARAYGTLVALDEAGAEAARRAMVSTKAADELVASTRTKLAALRETWPVGAITYQVAPVAVRVRMDGPDAANADVWYVGVVSGVRIATYEEWVTQSYRLVWERGDWRMAAEADQPGPRPDPGRGTPATPAELGSRLAGFEAVS